MELIEVKQNNKIEQTEEAIEIIEKFLKTTLLSNFIPEYDNVDRTKNIQKIEFDEYGDVSLKNVKWNVAIFWLKANIISAKKIIQKINNSQGKETSELFYKINKSAEIIEIISDMCKFKLNSKLQDIKKEDFEEITQDIKLKQVLWELNNIIFQIEEIFIALIFGNFKEVNNLAEKEIEKFQKILQEQCT